MAARELMASKKFVQYVETREFRIGWVNVLDGAGTSNGLERLLHVDLIMRISGLVKKLKIETEQVLTNALKSPLPNLALVAASDELPRDAKPAEIRENIANALKYTEGKWIHKYLITSLANEDRSQRCRVKFVDCLSDRTPNIETWIDDLIDQNSLQNIQRESNLNTAAKRLKEIVQALVHVIRQKRTDLEMTEATGIKLAKLAKSMIKISREDRLPEQLASASSELAILLDELLSMDLSLMVEPETYSSLSVIRNWWQMIPYPSNLVRALRPATSKLVTAIIIRARAGQKSSALVDRLADALGGRDKARRRLVRIAETQMGLLPEIDDWLRGRDRLETQTGRAVTTSLQGVSDQSLLRQFSPILLLSVELANQRGSGSIDHRDALNTVTKEIMEYARTNHIETFGDVGRTVEFIPELHSSKNGQIPTEAKVRILRSGVLRRRVDGSYDLLIKATVE